MTSGSDELITVKTPFDFNLVLYRCSFLAESMIRHGGVWEAPETDLIRSLVSEGDFCIDGGAHAGYFSCLMARLGAKVMAFEPNPRLYSLLLTNTNNLIHGTDAPVNPVPAALWDSNGKLSFSLPSDFDDGQGSCLASDLGRSATITNVNGFTLEQIGIGKIKLLKLDVEGAELYALKGAGNRLLDVENLLVETQQRDDHGDDNIGKVAHYLFDWGFKCYQYYDQSRDWKRVSMPTETGVSVWWKRT